MPDWKKVNAGKNANAGLTFLRQLPSMDVKGVSPSTSFSLQFGHERCINFTSSSMDVQGVSFPQPAAWAYRVYPFPPASSVDVQGVSLYNLVTEEVKIIDDDLNPFSSHSNIFLHLSTVQSGEGGSQNIQRRPESFLSTFFHFYSSVDCTIWWRRESKYSGLSLHILSLPFIWVNCTIWWRRESK